MISHFILIIIVHGESERVLMKNLGTLSDLLARRYEVIEMVKEGTFSSILKVQDAFTGSMNIVKMYHESNMEMGKREAERLMKLNQDNSSESIGLVRLQSTFKFRGRFCLLMEFLSLNSMKFPVIILGRKLETLQILRRISLELISTLIFLNDHSFIHGDLRPGHILMKEGEK